MNQIPHDGVVDQVRRAQLCLEQNDLNGALYNIAPAIDVTSKSYSSKKSGNRKKIEKFLEMSEKELIQFSTLGRVSISEFGNLYFGQTPSGSKLTLPTIIYKFLRCGQSHNSVIDYEKIYLGCEFGISSIFINTPPPDYKPGQHVISRALCFGLMAIVVLDESNAHRKFPKCQIQIGGKSFELNFNNFKDFVNHACA
jgi:hypothetical protein